MNALDMTQLDIEQATEANPDDWHVLCVFGNGNRKIFSMPPMRLKSAKAVLTKRLQVSTAPVVVAYIGKKEGGCIVLRWCREYHMTGFMRGQWYDTFLKF